LNGHLTMAPEEIVRYVLSFFGGGSVATVGGWLHSSWSARRAREVESLRDQLRLLYGPLYFFTSQNEELFKLSGNVQEARHEYFEGRKWSEEDATSEALTKQHLATIGLGNTYVERVIKNNERVMNILETNWHLVDVRDIEVLSRFQVDYTRYHVEAKEPGTKDVPFSVVMKLGDISFMHPDVIARVREAFQQKRARLVKLTGLDSG
jgi:hypothetical protein